MQWVDGGTPSVGICAAMSWGEPYSLTAIRWLAEVEEPGLALGTRTAWMKPASDVGVPVRMICRLICCADAT